MYSVCTVRIQPVRAEGLVIPVDPSKQGKSESPPVKNPLVIGQILPWKKTRRTQVLVGGGPNPSWISTSNGTRNNNKADFGKFAVDLPYYGHPYAGEIPSVTLMVVDVPNAEDNNNERSSSFDSQIMNVEPVFIGRANFDLRQYLSQKKNLLHGLTLSLTGTNGQTVGKLICTLQFVLTGTVRVTVLSGHKLRNNIAEMKDCEPYVQAKVIPGRSKWKKTPHKQGENPDFGSYHRKPTLASFYSFPSLAYFSSRKAVKDDREDLELKPTMNILEFKFKDEDRSQVPRVVLAVYDKMDTIAKRERLVKNDELRKRDLEKKIKSLRNRRKKEAAPKAEEFNLPFADDLAVSMGGNPRQSTARSNIFSGFFGNPRQATTKRRKNRPSSVPRGHFQEVPTKPFRSVEKEDQPLSSEEKELMERLENVSKRLMKAKDGSLARKDKLIGSGSIDLRPLLTFNGKREAQTVTVEIVDENGLAAGQVLCKVEFENSSHDPQQEVITVPDLNFDWRDLDKFRTLTRKEIVREVRNLIVMADMMLDLYAPNFVIRTSNQTGIAKIVVFSMFFSFNLLLLFSIWIGFGNKFMSYVVGVLYPTYESFKALERKNTDLNNQWLTYWIIYGMFNFLENTLFLPIVFIYPSLFYIFKIGLLLWLVNPKHLGASIIYYMIFAPLLRSYQNDIDAYISVFGQTTKNFVKDFAGFYDQLESEMAFALNKNLIENKQIFANSDIAGSVPNLKMTDFLRDSLDGEVDSIKEVKVSVWNEAGRVKNIMVNVDDDKIEDVLLTACSVLGLGTFSNYELKIDDDGKLRNFVDVKELERIRHPRLFVSKMASDESDDDSMPDI